MRWIVGALATLSLACLGVGLSFLSGDTSSSSVTLLGHAVSTEVVALGVIYFGVVCERLAVALGFVASRRAGRAGWSLALLSLCLLIVLNSLFFALRVRGLLTQRWTIADLPPEEVTPLVEALLFAPIALGYALITAIAGLIASRRAARNPQAALPTGNTSPPTSSPSPSPSPPLPASRGPITPPLPLPAGT